MEWDRGISLEEAVLVSDDTIPRRLPEGEGIMGSNDDSTTLVVVVGVLVGAAAERHSNTRAGKRPVGAVMVTFFLEAVPCAKANTLFT